jgi:two-component system response regulator FixJ
MLPPARRRILVVDDDDAVRDSLEFLLEANGYAVTSFASGRAFLDSGAATAGGCLILDLHLPDMSGFDVLRQLDPVRAGLRVIMITARSDAATRANAMEAGAAILLEKPFTEELLVSTIEQVTAEV